jgi:ssDNA-binding Zn-finger/Zn-ribbon topoisomerase 1
MSTETLLRDSFHFGACPDCDKECRAYQSEYRNVGRSHYFMCRVHRVFWWVGSNLFSSWTLESEETWRENERLLGTFRKVKASPHAWVPWHELARRPAHAKATEPAG